MILVEAQLSFQEYLVLLSHEERMLQLMNRQVLTDVNSQKEQVLRRRLVVGQSHPGYRRTGDHNIQPVKADGRS